MNRNIKRTQFANLYMRLDYQISIILSKELTKASKKKLDQLMKDRQQALENWKKEPEG